MTFHDPTFPMTTSLLLRTSKTESSGDNKQPSAVDRDKIGFSFVTSS